MNDTPAIYLDRVTRFYGRRVGLLDLSASIQPGTLVGLLGPNGAGKTTTIRILSCYMPPTGGTARICGFDVFTQSLEVRKRVGYLPENCPLYPEMRVIEYLRWIASLKGLQGSDVDRAIFDALGPCGIDDVRERMIGTLSKGYRQRVGLASVLLTKPPVLILDEPTIGLDPNQVREFRKLMASLKGKHTILLSSHILPEVEMLCDSVIILNEGRVVASGAPDDLRSSVNHSYRIQCRYNVLLPTLLPRLVERLPDTTLVEYTEDGENAYILLQSDQTDPRTELFRFFTEAGLTLVDLHKEKVTLEDVFVQYTQRSQTQPPANTTPSPAATSEATS